MAGRLPSPLARRRKARRDQLIENQPKWRTRLLGGLAGATVVAVSGAELSRIWRLGTLPLSRQEGEDESARGSAVRTMRILREGYAVSRTRDNAVFNMLASFTLAFATTRAITWTIRERGGIGPIKDVKVGDRHIHHFIPGGVLSVASGGVAIGFRRADVDRWAAFPFGIGVALVLDESALLLELDDVYWTEEGVLSVQIAFFAMALLAAVAFLIQNLRRSAHEVEADWETAAKAWDDLQIVPGISLEG
jgi:hypothetical protein